MAIAIDYTWIMNHVNLFGLTILVVEFIPSGRTGRRYLDFHWKDRTITTVHLTERAPEFRN